MDLPTICTCLFHYPCIHFSFCHNLFLYIFTYTLSASLSQLLQYQSVRRLSHILKLLLDCLNYILKLLLNYSHLLLSFRHLLQSLWIILFIGLFNYFRTGSASYPINKF